MTDESISSKRLQRVPMSILVMPLLWCGGVLLCAAIAFFLNVFESPESLLLITLIGCSAAIVNVVLLPFLDEDWAQSVVVLAWTALAGLAVTSVGGMSTSFVALFILPVAAAHVLGGPRLTMEAAALAMFAVALIVALEAGGMLSPVFAQAELLTLIGPLSVVLTLIASASALVVRRQGGWDAQSARLRLLRFAPDPLVCLDARGRMLAASPEARRILGSTRHLAAAFKDTYRARLAVTAERVLRSGKSEDVEVEMLGEDQDKSRRFELRFARDSERVLMVSMHDITKRAEREEQLIAERDAALSATHEKSQFLAGISHELRTPLNAIIGFSDMMKARLFGPLPAKYAEYADLIYDSGRHLIDLVGDVLDISKIEADCYVLNKTNFDLHDLTSSSIKLMRLSADEAGIKLKLCAPGGVMPVHADRKALRQVLFNLLSNAIKFTPGGGMVTVNISAHGGEVEIAVNDNGVGMSAGDLAKIGTLYQQADSAQTTDARGTGLGMALVQSLAELHDGSMNVQSQLGTGTSVYIRLPILDSEDKEAGEVTRLDVRDHIRRAQEVGDEIAQNAKKAVNG